MSDFISLSSVCGEKEADVDVFDVEENPYGVVCCERCREMLKVLEGES